LGQDYPNRQITILVGIAAGGITDVIRGTMWPSLRLEAKGLDHSCGVLLATMLPYPHSLGCADTLSAGIEADHLLLRPPKLVELARCAHLISTASASRPLFCACRA
jgi:hypothetical protein